MISFKSLFTVGLTVMAMLFAQPANAITVEGKTVAGISGVPGNTFVGVTGNGDSLIDAVKYFIPLRNGDGVYGVNGFGTSSDRGNGGGVLTMFLRFDGLTANSGNLSILFEDLDLINVNDPFGFFETVEVFDGNGTSLTQLIDESDDDIGRSFDINTLGGLNDNLELAIAFSSISTSTLFVELNFTASFRRKARNTAEYLTASFNEINQTTVVPLPAALPLYGTGLAIMGFIGWRRKRKTAA